MAREPLEWLPLFVCSCCFWWRSPSCAWKGECPLLFTLIVSFVKVHSRSDLKCIRLAPEAVKSRSRWRTRKTWNQPASATRIRLPSCRIRDWVWKVRHIPRSCFIDIIPMDWLPFQRHNRSTPTAALLHRHPEEPVPFKRCWEKTPLHDSWTVRTLPL